MTKLVWSLLATFLLANLALAYVVGAYTTAADYPAGAEIRKIYSVDKVLTIDTESSKSHGISQIVLTPDEVCRDMNNEKCLHVNVILVPQTATDVPGTIYKVTEVTFSKFLGSADITFQVSDEWLKKNELTADEIVIYYKSGSEWKALDSEKLNADEDNEYFQVKGTEDQGYFAVSTAEPEPEVEEETEGEEKPAAATGMATSTIGNEWTGWIIGAIVVLILIAVAAFGYYYWDSQQFKSSI